MGKRYVHAPEVVVRRRIPICSGMNGMRMIRHKVRKAVKWAVKGVERSICEPRAVHRH